MALTGSEKQIEWATSIMAGLAVSIDEYTAHMPPLVAEAIRQEITTLAADINNARWWIDHRNDREGLAYAVRNSNRTRRPARPRERDIPADMYLTDFPGHVAKERVQELRDLATRAGLPAESACLHGRYAGLTPALVDHLRSIGLVVDASAYSTLAIGVGYQLIAPDRR